MNRRPFYAIYWKLQAAIVPALRHSQAIYERVLESSSGQPGRWLDLGCGHHLLPPWRLDQERQLVRRAQLIVGIDYDHISLTRHKTIGNRVRGTVSQLPFADQSFDLITSNMVFEHLPDPVDQLREVARVLRPGGRLIVHTPNVFGYGTMAARLIPERLKPRLIHTLQGRKEEDVFPTFYRFNSVSQIRQVARSSGLHVVRTMMICASAQLIMLPPLVVFELLWIRLLMTRLMRPLRPNIIAILEKAHSTETPA